MIDNLLEDHRHIQLALDVLDASILRAAMGAGQLPVFERLVDFIVRYADGLHYEKEGRLFDAMMRQGVPCMAGPVQCLRMEHDGTRAQTDRMAGSIAQIRAGAQQEWPLLMDAAARYSAIVRTHIPKEDLGFFPMSDFMLPAQVKAELAAEFAAMDQAAGTSIADAARALDAGGDAPAAPAAPPQGKTRRSHVDFYPLEDRHLQAILACPPASPAPRPQVPITPGARRR